MAMMGALRLLTSHLDASKLVGGNGQPPVQRTQTMLVKLSALIAGLLLMAGPAQAAPQPVLEQLFKANRTPGDRVVAYPSGTPEMRMYRVTLPVGATIPLHIHPSPVVVVVMKGVITNVRLVNGVEVVTLVSPGDGFLEGHPDEPHYVTNKGAEPAEAIVTFASVVGMPNMIRME